MLSAPAKALAAVAASACLAVFGFSPAGAVAAEGECPNEALRVGFSAHLPDCRAYEVVTPEVGPLPLGNLIGTYGPANNMDTWLSSPDGESVIFDSNGSIQDENDNGRSDRYESVRTPAGWKMSFQGASGADSGGVGIAGNATVGGASPDHKYSFWQIGASGGGTLAPGNYLFERDGGFSWLGTGSLGHDVNAEGVWMTAGGSHVIFATADVNAVTSEPAVQLEPAAPPSPVGAIYDRPVGGPTSVVSLLPGDATPAAPAHYLGNSTDGRTVAFEVNGTTYVRHDDTTQAVAYAEPGTVLTCRGGELRWLRNGVPIGSTEPSYTVQPADVGTAIQCEATRPGSTIATSVPPTLITDPEAPIAPPGLRYPLSSPAPAHPTAGTLESCPGGEWSGSPTLAYQWYANGSAIAGATSGNYEVQGNDVPSTLQCSVSAQNSDGTVVAFSAAAQTSPAPVEAQAVPVVDVRGTTRADQNAPGSVVNFSGSTPDGGRIFYSRGGGAFAGENGYESFEVFEAADKKMTVIANEGAIWPVNVSEDGSHAYFVSTAALSGSGANTLGAEAEAGKHNLYVWDGAGVRFIAALNAEDVNGERPPGPLGILSGLGYWNTSQNPLGSSGGPARDPSRSSPDGSIFVFQTTENLLPSYDSAGHVEIFRYDADSGELGCVSCNPAGTAATADAELQTFSKNVSERIGVSELTHIPNISTDGKTVVFETRERLLPTEDEDDFYDVYRWKAGELALVSSGLSSDNDFLFGMSADASDIFFKTFDSLVSLDHDGGNYSIYDARVDGGFQPPISGPVCEGEGCQGGLAQAPALPSAATPTFRGAGNVSEPPRKKKHHKKKRHKHSNKHAHKAKKGGKR
jgi:hypothetical protein